MWAVGHTAAAYFSFLFVTLLAHTAGLIPSSNKPKRSNGASARLLFLVLVMSVWPDFMHFDKWDLRTLTHNGLAVVFVPLALFLVLGVFGPARDLKRWEAIVLVLSSVTHALCDTAFGDFYYWYPFTKLHPFYNHFNTPRDKAAETLLGLAFVVTFIANSHWSKLIKYISGGFNDGSRLERFLFWVWEAFLVLQFAWFAQTNRDCFSFQSKWYAWCFGGTFVLYMLVVASFPLSWFIIRLRGNEKKKI